MTAGGTPLRHDGVRTRTTVLVVDDDPVLRTLLTDLLQGAGYVVLVGRDAAEGLALANHRRPDVILLDLAIPGLSGVDVLHELKQHEATRAIPVIVVSAYARLMAGADARLADGVVEKPFRIEDLLAQVSRAAGGRHP